MLSDNTVEFFIGVCVMMGIKKEQAMKIIDNMINGSITSKEYDIVESVLDIADVGREYQISSELEEFLFI